MMWPRNLMPSIVRVDPEERIRVIPTSPDEPVAACGCVSGCGDEHRIASARRAAGYGASDPDLRPRDLARLADDLVGLCESFPHERLILIGHSWGGPVARMAAARLLERAGEHAVTRAVRDDLSAAHAASVRAHPAGRFVQARRSGHLVPFTEPELVAQGALALLR